MLCFIITILGETSLWYGVRNLGLICSTIHKNMSCSLGQGNLPQQRYNLQNIQNLSRFNAAEGIIIENK